MKTKLFLLFAILNISIASAQTFTVNGVKYDIIPTTTNVQVVANAPKYTGVVTIPESVIYNAVSYAVTSIGNSAFAVCTSLTTVNCEIATPLVVNANVFGNVNQTVCALNVPSGSVSLYEAAAVW